MTGDTDPDRVTVYSDYVCPFCYLGRVSLARYQDRREEPLSIDWHPFDLQADRRGPDGQLDEAASGGKDEAYYERARENVERLADEYGVDLAQTLVRDVDSRNAQLASVFVQMEHPERWLDFDWAVFEALWRNGRDVGDPDVLSELASDVGLDPVAVRDALTDDMVERRLTDQFEAARLRGISGVPTFVAGEHSVSGAVPPEHFERLLGP